MNQRLSFLQRKDQNIDFLTELQLQQEQQSPQEKRDKLGISKEKFVKVSKDLMKKMNKYQDFIKNHQKIDLLKRESKHQIELQENQTNYKQEKQKKVINIMAKTQSKMRINKVSNEQKFKKKMNAFKNLDSFIDISKMLSDMNLIKDQEFKTLMNLIKVKILTNEDEDLANDQELIDLIKKTQQFKQKTMNQENSSKNVLLRAREYMISKKIQQKNNSNNLINLQDSRTQNKVFNTILSENFQSDDDKFLKHIHYQNENTTQQFKNQLQQGLNLQKLNAQNYQEENEDQDWDNFQAIEEVVQMIQQAGISLRDDERVPQNEYYNKFKHRAQYIQHLMKKHCTEHANEKYQKMEDELKSPCLRRKKSRKVNFIEINKESQSRNNYQIQKERINTVLTKKDLKKVVEKQKEQVQQMNFNKNDKSLRNISKQIKISNNFANIGKDPFQKSDRIGNYGMDVEKQSKFTTIPQLQRKTSHIQGFFQLQDQDSA